MKKEILNDEVVQKINASVLDSRQLFYSNIYDWDNVVNNAKQLCKQYKLRFEMTIEESNTSIYKLKGYKNKENIFCIPIQHFN